MRCHNLNVFKFFLVKKTSFFLGPVLGGPTWHHFAVHFSLPFWGLKLLRNFKSFAAIVRVNSKHFPDEHAAQTASLTNNLAKPLKIMQVLSACLMGHDRGGMDS